MIEPNTMQKKNEPVKGELTWRELQVLKLFAQGRTHKEIADELCIGETTVKTHKRNINRKIDIVEMYTAIYDVLLERYNKKMRHKEWKRQDEQRKKPAQRKRRGK